MAPFIQPSKYFTLFWRIFPENGSGIPESVKREMKDAGFIPLNSSIKIN
jgi:hypothetical protein